MIKVSRLFLKKHNHFQTFSYKFSLMTDVTGSRVSVENPRQLVLLNQAILQVITSNNNSLKLIDDVLIEFKNCTLSNVLIVFQYLKYRYSIGCNIKVAKYLSNLSKLYLSTSNVLLSREKKFIEAAFAWSEGDFMKSGSILESILIDNPTDLLALKLAQECYMLSGCASNILSCITRYSQSIDDKNNLHGCLLGMIAAGFAELGKFNEAEELALRSLSVTGGKNGWALHTLLNLYTCNGYSSNIIEKFDSFEHNFTGSSRILLLYNRGCSYVARGNINSACRTYREIVFELSEETDMINQMSLSYGSFLLWQISLNAIPQTRIDFRLEFQFLKHLWIKLLYDVDGISIDKNNRKDEEFVLNSKKVVFMPSIVDVASTICLVFDQINSIPSSYETFSDMKKFENNINAPEYSSYDSSFVEKKEIFEVVDDSTSFSDQVINSNNNIDNTNNNNNNNNNDILQKKSILTENNNRPKTFFQRMFGSSEIEKPKIEKVETDSDDLAEKNHQLLNLKMYSDDEEKKYKKKHFETLLNSFSNINFSFDKHKNLFEILKNELNLKINHLENVNIEIVNEVRNNLEISVDKSYQNHKSHTNINSNSINNNSTEEFIWNRFKVSIPLCLAFESFMNKNYVQAVEMFEKVCNDDNELKKFGAPMVFRNVVLDTLLDSYMRSGNYTKAVAMINERMHTFPNNAQDYRRLAFLHQAMGKVDEARKASYTAWQLGIGQGGFGGPK